MTLFASHFANTPAALAFGELVITEPDFALPGLIPFELVQTYRPSIAEIGAFGRSRVSSLDVTIRSNGAESEKEELIYCNDAAMKVNFWRPTPGPGLWERNAVHPYLALAAGRNRTLILKDGPLFKLFTKFPDKIWRLSQIEDKNGNRLSVERDEAGLITRVAEPGGLALEFDNNNAGLRASTTLIGVDGERKVVARYGYDGRSNLTEVQLSHGPSRFYEYDDRNRLVGWSDGGKTWGRHEYDSENRIIRTRTSGLHDGDAFRYDPANHTTTYLPGGREEGAVTYRYNSSNKLISRVEAGVVVEEREYEGAQLTAVRDALGAETSFLYDSSGNVMGIADPEGRRTAFVYNEDSELAMTIDGNGADWEYVRDDKGNLVQIIDPNNHGVEIKNNERGQPVGMMRSDGMLTQFSYDAHHRLSERMDFRGGRWVYEHDGFGRLTALTEPSSQTWRVAYNDAAGSDFWEPSRVEQPDGVVVSHNYDRHGSVRRVTDGEGRTTTYRYGAFDLLHELEDANGGKLRLEYDGQKRLLSVTNQKGLLWTFERDAAGRVIRECDFDGLTIYYAYDAAGRVTEMRLADGARLSLQYDKSGLVVREELFELDAAEPGEVTVFGYDTLGQLASATNKAATVEFQRDKLGRVISETINGRTVRSGYDCCSNRVARKIGERLDEMAYDPLGAIRQLAIGDHAPLAFKRDAMGRETRRESGRGFHLDQAYDAVGQLIAQMANRREAGPLSAHRFGAWPQEAGHSIERSYTWSKASEPETITDALWGETAYRYDANGQVKETRFGEDDGERFDYDAALNISGFAEGTAPDRPAWAKGVAGSGWRPTTSPSLAWSLSEGGRVQLARGPKGEKVFLTHDVRGRVIERKVERDGFRAKIWRYVWDGKDRLVTCVTPDQQTWHYGYDPFGRRLWKKRELTGVEKRYYARKFPQVVGRPDHEWHYSEPMPVKGISLKEEVEGLAPVVGVTYQWDGNVIAEEAPLRLDGSINWDKATRWHYEPGTFRPLAKEEPIERDRADAENDGPTHRLLYVVTDHLGTPREMLTENGDIVWAASYTTWGRVRSLRIAVSNDNDGPAYRGLGAYYRQTGSLVLKPAPEGAVFTCPIRFQGQWEDEETGLYYNRFRYYDPLVAQYTSPDPSRLFGGFRPQNYVHAPTTWVDPNGLVILYMFETMNGNCYVGKGVDDGRMSQSQIKRTGNDGSRKPAQIGPNQTIKDHAAQCCRFKKFYDLATKIPAGMPSADDFALMVEREIMRMTNANSTKDFSNGWHNGKNTGKKAWDGNSNYQAAATAEAQNTLSDFRASHPGTKC